VTAKQIILPGATKPLSVEVTTHGKQVVQHFSEPREFTAFSGTEAVVVGTKFLARAIEADDTVAPAVVDMAMGLIDAAYEARGDLKPAGGAVKHELIERHRKTLTRRLEVVMNSQREKKTTSNHQLARQLVDIALSEIFS
jgi:hypothetical protein